MPGFSSLLLRVTLVLAAAIFTSASLVPRNSNNTMHVQILEGPTYNNYTDRGHAGLVASGNLEPFGSIGFTSSLNYNSKIAEFGGELYGGAPGYGLGGGFVIGAKNATVGFGIGMPTNDSADTTLTITKEGHVNFTFVSTVGQLIHQFFLKSI